MDRTRGSEQEPDLRDTATGSEIPLSEGEVQASPRYSASASSLEEDGHAHEPQGSSPSRSLAGRSPPRSVNGRTGSEVSLRPFPAELAMPHEHELLNAGGLLQDDPYAEDAHRDMYADETGSPMWTGQQSASYDVDLAMGLQAAVRHDDQPQASAEEAGYLSDSHLQRARQSPAHERFYQPPPARSPARKPRAGPALRNALTTKGTVAPGQPGRVRRVKDKVLTLELRDQSDESSHASLAAQHINVTAYCIAFELDLAALEEDLQERFGLEHVHAYPQDLKASQTADIVHARFVDDTGAVAGDVIYFEFGVVVAWNLSSGQEAEAVWQLAGKHMLQRLPEADIEVDELTVECGPTAQTMIKDDTLFMTKRVYEGVMVRLAVSLALAQSTRISAQETQVMEMIEATKALPFQLVQHGSVTVPHGELAILIGKVFLQKSALNLQVLSGHKETPKLFWGKPDNLQVIYHAVSEYLDLDERADILNRRFTALTDMLDLLRDQQSTRHEEHLELIVIFLIVVSACLGLLQIASLIRSEWVRHGTHPALEYAAAAWDLLRWRKEAWL